MNHGVILQPNVPLWEFQVLLPIYQVEFSRKKKKFNEIFTKFLIFFSQNLSGFGCFMRDQISDPQSYGIYIVDRRDIGKNLA